MIPPKPPRKVIVCGGRAYADRANVFVVLDALHSHEPIDFIVHGGASGADALAGAWAAERRVKTLVFPADWNTHGRAAGPIRNQQMADASHGATLLAFPGGAGTADMIRRATAARIPVERVG